MPATYEPIATYTAPSAQTGYTFTAISGAYTDLILVANILPASSARVKLRLDGDSGNNYSYTILTGNGSSATSGRESSISEINYYWNGLPTGWSNYILQFQNYSNTTTFKTILGRGNSTAVETFASVGLWRSTSAIDSIELRSSVGTFDTGSTFTLYGIKGA
jgi:hypothetical protein